MYYVATYTSSATLALLLATLSFIKGKGLVQLSVMLVVDVILIANLLYSRTYASEIPPASYLLIGNLSEFKSAVISSLRWHDVGFPVISLCTWLIIRRLPVTSDPAALRYWIITFAVGIGATLCLSIRYGGINNHISNMRNDRILHLGPAVVYTLPSALIQHGFSTSESVSESRVRKANLFLGNRFSLSPAPDTTTPRRKNLVLIIVESLESWVIGAEIQGQEITPCLNLEAGDSTSWYAPKVFSQAGEGRSIDGQLLMTTGIYPTVNPVFSYGYPDSSYPSLAKELKKACRSSSYLLSATEATCWNQAKMADSFGFDRQMHSDSWKDKAEYFDYEWDKALSDGCVLEQITDKMKSGEIWPEGETAFLEILTVSTHYPFYIPDNKKGINVKWPAPNDLPEYCTAVSYTDRVLGKLISYIKSRPDWSETMVVIVGDHQGLDHSRKEIREFEGGKYASLVSSEGFVPMIVLNAPVPGRRNEVMGQIDVYSTILDQMGITPVWPGMGFSALDPDLPSYAAGYPVRPKPESARADSILRLIDAQPRVGATIIAADLLRNRLPYSAPRKR